MKVELETERRARDVGEGSSLEEGEVVRGVNKYRSGDVRERDEMELSVRVNVVKEVDRRMGVAEQDS